MPPTRTVTKRAQIREPCSYLLREMASANRIILTFKPEFVDAFELGSKNTLLDGALTLNADLFYYNYENYQISEIVDRTSINLNFDAHVKGAELESTWEPVPGLRFLPVDGKTHRWRRAIIDLIDRTAGIRLDGHQAVHRAGLELHFANLCRCSEYPEWRNQFRRGQPWLHHQACGAYNEITSIL